MLNLSLKWKIVLVGVAPLICFVAMASLHLIQQRDLLREARQTQEQVRLIAKVSPLVDVTQKERGATATFLKGGMSQRDIIGRRATTDVQIKEFQAALAQRELPAAQVEELNQVVARYQGIRDSVDQGALTLGQSLKAYTGIVSELLQVQLDAAEHTELAEVAMELRSLRIIEDSKEAAGKLRANLSSILAADQKLSEKQFNLILSLKSGVGENLRSSGLVLNEQGKALLQKFTSSENWSEVNQTFKLVLKKSGEGNYGRDPKAFFATISGAIGFIADMIAHKNDGLEQRLGAIVEAASRSLWMVAGALVLSFVLLGGFISFLTTSTNRSLNRVVRKLSEGAESVQRLSQYVNDNANEIAGASQQQADSLQKTATAIDEISAMVNRNSEAAAESQKLGRECTDSSVKGKGAVQRMLSATENVHHHHTEVISHIEQKGEQLSEITQLISEIRAKTTVINDIVFQTKLLSFNASVEAARAGEHGKGFAVVAEEIGNLAHVSGAAAQEISQLLETSTGRVQKIVEESKVKSQRLSSESQGSIDQSLKMAKECDQELDHILSRVKEVDQRISGIAVASAEQAQGVSEISDAVGQSHNLVHMSVKTSQHGVETASSLGDESARLGQVVQEILSMIGGGSEIKAAAIELDQDQEEETLEEAA